MKLFTIYQTEKDLYCRSDNKAMFYEFTDALSNSRSLNRRFIEGEHSVIKSYCVKEYRDDQNSVIRQWSIVE